MLLRGDLTGVGRHLVLERSEELRWVAWRALQLGVEWGFLKAAKRLRLEHTSLGEAEQCE